MRHFVVDSLHYGFQAVFWSKRGERTELNTMLLQRLFKNKKTQVLQSIVRFYYIKLGGVSTKAMLLWVHKDFLKAFSNLTH